MALGWLGWSEERTLYSDVNAIIIGYEARRKMFREILGVVVPDAKNIAPPIPLGDMPSGDAAKPRVLTPSAFDAMFGSGSLRPPVSKGIMRTSITVGGKR